MVLAGALVQEEVLLPRRRSCVSPRKSSSPGFKSYAYVLCGCLVLFGVNAMLHGLVTASSARVEVLTGELTATRQDAEEMSIEIAYLSSYPRIAREAESRLAMRAPAPGQFRFNALEDAEPVFGAETAHAPEPPSTGLMASVGDWLRTFGRTEASVR